MDAILSRRGVCGLLLTLPLLAPARAEEEAAHIMIDNFVFTPPELNVKTGTKWQVFDVMVEGVSFVQTFRSQFDAPLNSKSIKQVATLRGRLGAFQKFTIGSTVNSLGIAFENASAAESAIRDTDFAEETSKLTRSQILSQAASTVLAQANSAPQSALALLRG